MAANDNQNKQGDDIGEGDGGSRFFGPSLYGFAAAAVIAGGFCYYLKGADVFQRILWEEGELLLIIAPRVAAALLLAGLIQVLVPQDLVSKWIGTDSGLRGIVVAAGAGMLTPGGPITAFAVLYTLYASGANRGPLVAYLTGWAMLGIQRTLVWEMPFLGADFVLLRYAACVLLPILAGLIATRLPIIPAPPRAPGTPGTQRAEG
jgi:uncharacterized membrane protein YraQ (UPF0718 family)